MEFGSSSVADKLFPIATNFETVSKAPGSVVRAQAPLPVSDPRYILNHMVQYSEPVLDASFAALSDATRRGVLEQLGRAHASITDLAEKFHMTLTGMKKHVGVLERAGLVTTKKVGRVRTCKLGLRGLEKAHDSNFQRPGPCRLQCLDQTRTAQALVGTQIVWSVLPFLRGRCSYGRHVPFRVQSPLLGAAYVIFR